MVTCPSCQLSNEEGAAVCTYCGEKLKRRSWWRGFLRMFSRESGAPGATPLGEEASTGMPQLPIPAIEAASGESERLRLFEEWIEYGRRKESIAGFYGDKEILVDFVFDDWPEASKVHVGIEATREEGNKLVELLSEPVVERLVEGGFHPPDSDHVYHYWQEFDATDSRTLAGLAESVFREILGEDENFTAYDAGLRMV